MATLLDDVRCGLRALRATPGPTLVAALTLAIGIGAGTSIFTAVNGALLRPPPYPEPDRLVTLTSTLPGSGFDRLGLTEAEVLRLSEETGTFAALGTWAGFSANLSGAAEPARIRGALVSPGLLEVLRARPVLGRGFTDEEARQGAAVALLGDGSWRRRFGADPGVLGRRIEINGSPVTVIGVLPPGLVAPSDLWTGEGAELWLPRDVDPADPDWGSHTLDALARLAPGITPESARATLQGVVEQLAAARPDAYPSDQRATMYVEPLGDRLAAPVRPALRLLGAAVALLLLIACANVANLLLAKAKAREREMGIRTALGAGRARIVRQVLVESLLLALIAGAGGLVIAWWSFDLIVRLAPAGTAPLLAGGFDGRVLLFALALSAATALLFGLGPAWRLSRLEAGAVLGSREGSAERRERRAGKALVVAEVALATLLVVGAGLLLRSFVGLLGIDPGFDPRGILTARVTLLPPTYREPGPILGFFDAVVERARSHPAVESAAAVTTLPLRGFGGDTVFDLEGKPSARDDPAAYGPVYPHLGYRPVTPGYFRTLDIPLLEGRALEPGDDREAPLVVVVNRTFAERFFPGVSPLGSRLRLHWSVEEDGPWATIVGVVGDSRINSLTEEAKQEIFVTLRQVEALGGWSPRSATLLVKTAGRPESLAAPLRTMVRELDPAVPLYDLETLDRVVDSTLGEQRFGFTLLGLFAAVALLLAAIGIYGLIAYSVTRRRREIGVRMALGARAPDLLRDVLGGGLRLTAYGLGLGLAGAALSTRLLAGQLYGVTATDPATFAGVALLLLGVAAAASYLPARRAMRLDPVSAIREE